MKKTPINVFTGYLGSGKTTIIFNLIDQIEDKNGIVFLKNEFGNSQADTALLSDKSIKVSQIFNGCICCVQIGKLEEALSEIYQTYSPTRVILETNGTSNPAAIAIQINKVPNYYIDSIINIVDCTDLISTESQKELIRMQAKYTDFIVLNKIELTTKNEIETIEDLLYDIAPTTPKIYAKNGLIQKDLIFGIISTLPKLSIADIHEYSNSLQVSEISLNKNLDETALEKINTILMESDIWRVKGIIKLNNTTIVYNFVNKRFNLTNIENTLEFKSTLQLIGPDADYYADKIRKCLSTANSISP